MIDRRTWKIPAVFQWLQGLGNVATDEMFRVFNMGVGLIFAVPAQNVDAAVKAASTPEYPAFVIGRVEQQATAAPAVRLVE